MRTQLRLWLALSLATSWAAGFPKNPNSPSVVQAVSTESEIGGHAHGNPAGSQSIPPPVALIIADAKAADGPEGSKVYARQLTEWFVSDQTGDTYIDAFASRLSTADLMARQGKRELIPETVVARAFNDLMSRVHAPLRTDTNVVHQLRNTLYAVSPSLSTVNSDSSGCLPSEAVHLMIQLLLDNGTLGDLCPPQPDATGRLVQHACPGRLNAGAAISQYLYSHSRSQNETLYNHVAEVFGM